MVLLASAASPSAAGQRLAEWSARTDSNRRHSAWEADALREQMRRNGLSGDWAFDLASCLARLGAVLCSSLPQCP